MIILHKLASYDRIKRKDSPIHEKRNFPHYISVLGGPFFEACQPFWIGYKNEKPPAPRAIFALGAGGFMCGIAAFLRGCALSAVEKEWPDAFDAQRHFLRTFHSLWGGSGIFFFLCFLLSGVIIGDKFACLDGACHSCAAQKARDRIGDHGGEQQ